VPKPPLPAEIAEFLANPNPAVIATVAPDGSPHTAATWYLLEDGRVLVNMDRTRKRLEHMRGEPRVSLTIMGPGDDWYRQVTLRGRVATIEDDPEFEGADRLSRQFTGGPHARRDQNRVSAWIEIESWYGWLAGRPWTGSD
jgi:PPOX class probable F420-dependent enzyme